MITLYHQTTRTPVTLRLRRDILVQAYRKPERVGSLIIPAQALGDRTQTLWEVLESSEPAEQALGMALARGTILQTPRRWPTGMQLVTEDGMPALLLSVGCKACPEHPAGDPVCGIRGIVTYSDEEAADG